MAGPWSAQTPCHLVQMAGQPAKRSSHITGLSRGYETSTGNRRICVTLPVEIFARLRMHAVTNKLTMSAQMASLIAMGLDLEDEMNEENAS